MAHFRGTLCGNRSEVSRLGSKASGMLSDTNGWTIGAKVHIEYNEETKQDEVTVYITKGSSLSRICGFILGTYTTTEDRNIIRIR